jgi:hypothetical protein
MTEQELINLTTAELTQSCALPYSLKEPEIKRLIQRATRWFYENYQYAVEEKYIAIPKNVYEHPEFIGTRMIKLPDCVVAVYDLREVTGVGIVGQPDRDFSDSKLLGAEIFLSPFQGDNLVYRTAMYSYFDLAKQYDLQTIAYRYNRHTNNISVLGRNPSRNTYIHAGVKIPLEALYGSEIFIRYVLADAKINLGRTLQVFSYNLPGGVQINFDGIKNDGLEEMREIKEQIDGENTPDWFIEY